MNQEQTIHFIETQRDLAITARNLLLMDIQENGNSHEKQKKLSRLQGNIGANNTILDEIRSSIVRDTLEEWQNV